MRFLQEQAMEIVSKRYNEELQLFHLNDNLFYYGNEIVNVFIIYEERSFKFNQILLSLRYFTNSITADVKSEL